MQGLHARPNDSSINLVTLSYRRCLAREAQEESGSDG
jgi:hypothetical protein